jgi:hypothetical protein
MSVQGWLVLVAAAAAVLYFGRKASRNLGRKGANAGCGCCDGGGACGKPKAHQ